MSDDIKNFREAVEKFDELLLNLDVLDDKLSSNISNYVSTSENISTSTSQQKNIIEAISNLQIETKNLIDNFNEIDKTIYTKINDFVTELEYTLNNSINKIDMSKLSNKIERILEDDIVNLKINIQDLKNINIDFKEADRNLKTISNNVVKQSQIIKHTTDKFNIQINKINRYFAFVFIGIGTIIGALLMGSFGLKFLENRMFRNEQIAIQQYLDEKNQLETTYANASKLEEKARKLKIEYIIENKEKYIIIPRQNVIKSYDNSKYQIWQLRN